MKKHQHWHALSLPAVFEALATGAEGLSATEAAARAKRHGINALPRAKPLSRMQLLLSQFANPLIYILLIATAISLYLGHYHDAIFIVIVLLLNTLVGFYQENKANMSLEALKRLVTISTSVIRDGALREVDSVELVPGDVIFLKAGSKVPADARLTEARGLKVDESALTGEWIAVSKTVCELPEDTPLPERSNILHMGTIVEDGSATAVVVATGTLTAIGGVVSLLRETKERKTPLQQKIASLSRLVGAFILAVVTLIVIEGYASGKDFAEIFVTSLALAVSAIPSGLLPTITVILALGMHRILMRRGLVRKLIANETLGSVTVIATDKTGTLTEGKMEVAHILAGRELVNHGAPIASFRPKSALASHMKALTACVLTGDAYIENPEDELGEWVVRGRSTERALLLAGTHAGLTKRELEREFKPVERVSFSERIKYSASLYERVDGTAVLYAVGAPEILAARSSRIDLDGKKEPLDHDTEKRLLTTLDRLAERGLRVVACAYRELPKGALQAGSATPLTDEVHHLTFLGFVALKDPLRKDAKDSIARTRRAGIRTVLVTGDHRRTAEAIAREVGILEGEVVEGRELDNLTDEVLRKRAPRIAIYARVSPAHKLKIVQALQKNGEVVAVLGDGVNDAPALKAADVGVAVGSGTDVAKEVADIVLLDDNFRTILEAIQEGRVIFQNIRKVFVYLVADDFSELFIFITALAFGYPLPLLATQILWINLVEDGFPNIALTTERETEGVMSDMPRSPKEPILNTPLKLWLLSIFFVSGSAAFLLFVSQLHFGSGLDHARSMAFALMCLDSLIFSFSVRSFRRPILRADIFSNRLLVAAAVMGFVLLVAAIYFPPLQALLSTVSLSFADWLTIALVSLAEITLIESFKRLIFRSAAAPRPVLT